jgi:ABC-type Na+ efflux pump permease subunit
MTFLPIVVRELRVATRRRVTYWSRVAAAVVAVALVFWIIFTVTRFVLPEEIGGRLFKALSHLAFFLCLWPGVVLTADCLSEEKRDGTLGLLFLTDLRGYDVVLGKLIGTSLGAFYALLAIFPALALPLMLGGVTAGEFWRVALALANTMTLSLALGLVMSAISVRAQRAMLGTALAVALITYFLPALGGLFVVLSPLTLFRQSFDSAFGLGVSSALFLFCFAWQHAMIWGLLALASVVAPYTWQGESFFLRRRARAGRTAVIESRPFRSRLRDGNPVEWLGRRGAQSMWCWLSLALAAMAWLAWAALRPTGAALLPALVFGAVVWQGILQFWMAWEASRRLCEDRRSGALEMLLSTPVRVDEIVSGQMRSLRRQFLLPILTVLALETVLLVVTLTALGPMSGEGPSFMAVMVSVMGTLATSAYGLGWLGLWMGLKSRRTTRGALEALGWVVLLPLAVFMGSVACLLSVTVGGVPQEPTALAVVWFMISGASAHLFVEHARHRLHAQFRQVVSGEALPRRTLLARPAAATRTTDAAYGGT